MPVVEGPLIRSRFRFTGRDRLRVDQGAVHCRVPGNESPTTPCRRSHISNSSLLALLLLLGAPAFIRAGTNVVDVVTDPATVLLSGPNAHYSLLVHGRLAEGRLVDLTRAARFKSNDPTIASVSESGVIRSASDGSTVVAVDAAGQTQEVRVVVEGATRPRRFNFEHDIVPLLSKLGCNASGCHGKAEGQNGFKLSVFGFDPRADYAALTEEARGRRVFPAAPEQSLVLTKMTGSIPHGGGVRCAPGSDEYETIRGWIAAGLPFGAPTDPHVIAIRVEPRERLLEMGARQALRVVARDSAGAETDVTNLARFQSNNDALAAVDTDGMVAAGESPGEVAIMATYMGSVDLFQALIPRPDSLSDDTASPENNVIDTLVYRRLRKLNIRPSGPADDAEYLRRVYIDLIGTLPTPDEARNFLADTRPDRRARLVDALLERPEYADYWALKWADLLRVDRQALGQKRAYNFYRWIRESLASNQPIDKFAREIVTAEGPLDEVGPTNFYKVVARPGDEASTLSQVFLGVRLACAECHHHPFDRWSQQDYYGMQAF